MKNYHVYILANWNNKVLYVGVTNNLERRIYEHKQKLIPGFTHKYNVTKLVYFSSFPNIEDAISAEKKIKGWLRKKKDTLITKQNPEWIDLWKDSSLRSE
jgi:putative endonuclease